MRLNINYDLSAMHVVVSRSLCKASEQLVEWSRGAVQTAADWWEKWRTAESLGPCGDNSHLPSSFSFLFLSQIWFILGLSINLIHHRANVDSLRLITINTTLLHALCFILLGQKHSCVCILDDIRLPFFSVSLSIKQEDCSTLCWRVKWMADGADNLIVKVKRGNNGALQWQQL